jgi:hypothetical protein
MSRLACILILLVSASCGDDDPLVPADAPIGIDAAALDAAASDGAASVDAGAAKDGPGRDGSVQEECLELRAKWTALVMPLGQSCDAPSDCAVVGERGVRSCEGYPQLPSNEFPGSCNGVAVNQAALQPIVDEVRALEQAFHATCGNDRTLCSQGLLCVADCAPGAMLTCIDNRCRLTVPTGCL